VKIYSIGKLCSKLFHQFILFIPIEISIHLNEILIGERNRETGAIRVFSDYLSNLVGGEFGMDVEIELMPQTRLPYFPLELTRIDNKEKVADAAVILALTAKLLNQAEIAIPASIRNIFAAGAVGDNTTFSLSYDRLKISLT